MSDYQKGLVDGFKLGLEEGKKITERSYMDGYNDGLEEGKRNQNLNSVPSYYPDPAKSPSVLLKETCPKCGITISGVMNYTCQSINCPTYYKTWTGPGHYNSWIAGSHGAVGAVGSMSANYESSAPGTNGPCGPTDPIDYSMR